MFEEVFDIREIPIMSSAAVCRPTFGHGDGESKLSSAPKLSLDPRIVSGAMGSVVSGAVVTPFEVAKVKQQTYRPALPNGLQPGVLSTIRSVVAAEGVQGAFTGLAPTLAMSVPSFVLFLISTDEIVAYLKRREEQAPKWSLSDNAIPLVGGAIARLIASTAVAPLELLRTRAASLTNTNVNHGTGRQPAMSVLCDLQAVIKKDGIGALYRGLIPTLWRDVPFAAIYMLSLESFRKATRPVFLSDDTTSRMRQAGVAFTNAALAGIVAASCTAPLDVAKTRLQSAAPLHQGQNMAPQSTPKVLRNIVRNEGLAGLWKGNTARMMKVAPQYAIMISFYEVGKQMLAH